MSKLISPIYDNKKLRRKAPKKAKPRFVKQHDIIEKKAINKERKRFASELEESLPKSEKWFRELYEKDKDINDFYNKPLGNYIPDISNYRFKYVIEVDGSMHDCYNIKQHDIKKNNYYKLHDYKVIRIKAYNETDFNKMLFILNIIRGKIIKKGISFNDQESINKYMLSDNSPTPTKVIEHSLKGAGIAELNPEISTK